MKKVMIITRHNVNNFGSFLQSFVTQEKVYELGYNSVIINYIPLEENPQNIFNTTCLVKHRTGLKKVIFYLLVNPINKKIEKNFQRIRTEYLKLSPICDETNIGKIDGDIFLAGSDQLWGEIGTKAYDLNYFLSFANSSNKFAYSASIGKIAPNESFDKNVKKELSQFRKIGVREKSAVDYLAQIGLHSSLVLDPTFLYSKDYYSSKIKFNRSMRREYILVYQLHDIPGFSDYLKKISKAYKLPVYRVHVSPLHVLKFGKIRSTQNPFEFLGYVANAKYVITDSFHCTVFNIIFQKQFVCINPGSTSTRITNILNVFDLQNRMVDFNDIATLKYKISYKKVNEKLDILRNQSIKFLKEELDSAINE